MKLIFFKKRGCGVWTGGLEHSALMSLLWCLVFLMRLKIVDWSCVGKEFTEVRLAVCASWLLRITAPFPRRCLKFEYLKRYVGGLVQFDGSTSHIDFLGFWADYGRSASLFERTLFLWKRCASNRDCPVWTTGRCAEVWTSRISWQQLFNLRVWSWLRTNAGGRPNTCKSSAPSGERRTG